MIGLKVRTIFTPSRIMRPAKSASLKNLGKAGGYLRLVARHSIKRSKKPSLPGTPPHTRRGQLRRAIMYAVERERMDVVIGPEYGSVGTSGMAHEFGGRYRSERFDKRPFMGPALTKTKDKLPQLWANSIRE